MLIPMQDLMSREKTQTIETALNVESLLKGRRDVISHGPLDVRLTARGEAGLVHVDGELATELEVSCSRCLSPVRERLEIPFHEQFKPAQAAAEGEEDDIIQVEGDKLDLQPYVEEALLLYLPFAPLCAEDCKGLCPQCGTNLNEEQCGCVHETVDPRLAALKDLFKDSK